MSQIPPTVKIAIDDYALHDDYIEIETNGKEVKLDRFMFEMWAEKTDRWVNNYWEEFSRALIQDDLQAYLNVFIQRTEQRFKGTYSVILDIVKEIV